MQNLENQFIKLIKIGAIIKHWSDYSHTNKYKFVVIVGENETDFLCTFINTKNYNLNTDFSHYSIEISLTECVNELKTSFIDITDTHIINKINLINQIKSDNAKLCGNVTDNHKNLIYSFLTSNSKVLKRHIKLFNLK